MNHNPITAIVQRKTETEEGLNMEYVDLVYYHWVLTNKKKTTVEEDTLIVSNNVKKTFIELSLSANEIIRHVKYAFKHIPARIAE